MIPGLTSVWLRLEWRRRGRSAVVLALLIAFALGTVLTAVAGARRADSAYDRLAARTLPSTITVLPNQPGFDWDRVRAFPEVEAVTTFVVGGFNVEDPPSFSAGAMPPGDDHVFHGTEVPVVLAGRLYDPAREDEVVVSQAFVDRFGRSAGDRVVLRLGAPDEVGINADSGIPYTGPRIEATIVGVVRSPWYMDIVGDSDGMMLGTPELIRRYPGSFLGADRDGYVNALVRLHGGAAQIEAFKTRLTQLTGRDDIDVWNNADKGNRLKRLIAFEAACLLAFGLAAFGAAVVIIGQAVARYTAAASVDLRALRALGMTPRQAIRAAVTPPLLSAAAGAL
ncbi:hypothetical protein FDA94_31955, partial [Herbidospora galbida]